MDKQEAIKQAYGEYFDTYKDFLNENGRLYRSDFLSEHRNGFLVEKLNMKNLNGYFWPSSLTGVEHNNGWIKIGSESDLPSDRTQHYKVVVDGLKGYREAFYDNGKWCFIHMDSEGDKHISSYDHVTHYKPIKEDLPPLY